MLLPVRNLHVHCTQNTHSLHAVIAEKIAPRNSNITSWMRHMSTGINRGILQHATTHDPKYGTIYAYEIDGYGSHITMDDPNVPSLLSAPFLHYTTLRD